MKHSRRFASFAKTIFALAVMLAAIPALAQTPVDTGVAWLNAHQNTNGTWGATPELVPRDTALNERLDKNRLLSPERRTQRYLAKLDREATHA